MPDAPGRGKTPAQRQVDIEAAPNPLADLMSRPAKNSQEITGVVPDISQRSSVPAIEAAPVVDVRDLVDRAVGRMVGRRSGDGALWPEGH